MAEEKKKQRRVKGDAYWKLNGYLRKVQKSQEELGKWQRQKAEEAIVIDPVTAEVTTGVYPDLINWNTGAIFAESEMVKGMSQPTGKEVGRLDKEAIAEQQEKMDKAGELNDEISDYRNELAKALDVWPEQIDWKTGKIDTEEFDGEELPENLDDLKDDEPEADEPEADKPEE